MQKTNTLLVSVSSVVKSLETSRSKKSANKFLSRIRLNLWQKPVKCMAAFTITEIMIVVAIIGILAAIMFPEFQSHVQKAKETAAKENLQILRDAIERYSLDHNGSPPGYRNGELLSLAHIQLTHYTDSSGNGSSIKTIKYCYGPYTTSIPQNPFSGQIGILVIRPDQELESVAATTEEIAKTSQGWIFDATHHDIRLNWPGTDSSGTPYLNY